MCIKIIADQFEFFRTSTSLGCAFIRADTLKQLISLLPTTLIKHMNDHVNYHFPSGYVAREVQFRRNLQIEEYKALSIEQLVVYKEQGKSSFPELVERELFARKEQKPAVCINISTASPYLTISNDMFTAKLKKHKRYATLQASQCRAYDGWGKCYLEVHIEKYDSSYVVICGECDNTVRYGCTISVGWDSPREHVLDNVIPGLTKDNRGQFGTCWVSDGCMLIQFMILIFQVLHMNGNSEFVDCKFSQGDTVGLLLDQDARTLSFFKNGLQLAFGKKNASLPIVDKFYKLAPTICLYSSKTLVPCQVRFNFAGPFAHILHNSEPYSN